MDLYTSKKSLRIGLLVRMTGISVIFVIVAVLSLAYISIKDVQTSSLETAVIMGTEKLNSDMLLFEDWLEKEYGQLNLT